MLQRAYHLLEKYAPSSIKSIIPEKWRIWLGYQIHIVRAANNLQTKRDLPVPVGENGKSMHDYLAKWSIEGEGMTQERLGYLNEAFHRFLYTLDLVPNQRGKLLEVGANPYFITLLLHRFRPQIAIETVNYFPGWANPSTQTLIADGEASIDLIFANVNIEAETLPHEDGEFDIVLLCEVLEHFTTDPLQAILEMKRVLKQGGTLILTTPNVARLENIARMLGGDNLYDPYSGYGPHGRHNREYTAHELTKLLTHAGFTIEQQFTSDVYPDGAHRSFPVARFRRLIRQRKTDLGQYHFIRAVNSTPANPKKPSWLYRSYPSEQID